MKDTRNLADLDTYKIVILKCKPGSLSLVEQYLANRDWEVHSTSNLRVAIAAMIKNKPDFIFVATDHPNKKARVLPKLISQALGVNVIGFIESSSPSAMQGLNELKLEYVLFPPVSGPSIERLINRIKKDELRAEEQAEKESHRTHSEESAEPTSQEEESEVSEESEDSQADSEDSKNRVDMPASAKKKKGPGFYLFSGGKKKEKKKEAGSQDARKLLEQLLHEESKSELDSKEPVLIKKEGSKMHSIELEKDASQMHSIALERDAAKEHSAELEKKASNMHSAEGEKNVSKELESEISDFKRMETSTPKNFSIAPSKASKTVKIQDYRKQAPVSSNDSIFVRGTQEALDSSVYIDPNLKEVETLKNSSNAACIVVESPRFSGYLVAALGADREIDEKFIDSVKSKLVEFLKKHGEAVKDSDDGMEIKLETVDFEDWALDQAEFLRKSIHGNTEVAMAFFPNSATQVRLEQSANENMLQMDLSELKDDVPVEFDMYIYMPSNNKYILYTPQGRKFAGQQKGRLIEKGVQKIHMRKDSQGQVKKYRAQVFLNDKIEAYRSGLKKKKLGS